MEEIKKKIKNKGGRIQANVRRKSVLEQLEKHYNAFKNKGEDKPSWTTHGGTKVHKGTDFKSECIRIEKEIAQLKKKIF